MYTYIRSEIFDRIATFLLIILKRETSEQKSIQQKKEVYYFQKEVSTRKKPTMAETTDKKDEPTTMFDTLKPLCVWSQMPTEVRKTMMQSLESDGSNSFREYGSGKSSLDFRWFFTLSEITISRGCIVDRASGNFELCFISPEVHLTYLCVCFYII